MAPKQRAAATAPSHHAGLDENGLGPRLGPLLVTGVLAQAADPAAAKLVRGPPLRSLASRLGDSKQLVGFGHSALGEAWARAILRARGVAASTPSDVLHQISLDSAGQLREPCGERHGDQCWRDLDERFEASDDVVAAVEKDLGVLRRYGIDVLDARLVVTCVKRLNDARASGLTRLDVDLRSMERLFLAFRGTAGADVDAVCGKVGGIDRYRERFRVLDRELCTAVAEGKARSAYDVAGAGRIAFVVDADSGNMLVALASLIGKWARDLLMSRIIRFYRAADPSLPVASGYQDPLTRQFVDGSAGLRRDIGIPGKCFERD